MVFERFNVASLVGDGVLYATPLEAVHKAAEFGALA